jgi:hypothetical protein
MDNGDKMFLTIRTSSLNGSTHLQNRPFSKLIPLFPVSVTKKYRKMDISQLYFSNMNLNIMMTGKKDIAIKNSEE